MSDMFDFGFTACTEAELEAVQKASAQVQQTAQSASEAQDKLNKLYNAILPLLGNLKKNAEKDYIYWPNRAKKVEEFEDYIQKIVGYGQ